MEIIKTEIDDLLILQHHVHKDSRGTFVKTYNQSLFKKAGIDQHIRERYYSVSHKDVIRGMHFQAPPHDHIKLVNVIQGALLDVTLDLRKSKSTYGKFFTIELNGDEGKTLYIPHGIAHGFLSLCDNTIIEYNQTTEYESICDEGVKYNSFGYDWPIEKPIISDRDQGFQTFNKYRSPF